MGVLVLQGCSPHHAGNLPLWVGGRVRKWWRGRRGKGADPVGADRLVHSFNLTRWLESCWMSGLNGCVGSACTTYLRATVLSESKHTHTHALSRWVDVEMIAFFARPGVLRSGDPSGNLSSPCKRKCQLPSARGCSVASRLRLPAQLCTTVSCCNLDLSCATSKSDDTYLNVKLCITHAN